MPAATCMRATGALYVFARMLQGLDEGVQLDTCELCEVA